MPTPTPPANTPIDPTSRTAVTLPNDAIQQAMQSANTAANQAMAAASAAMAAADNAVRQAVQTIPPQAQSPAIPPTPPAN
ncbi:MAG: hypothetical protein HYV96_11820 [Opitutae bacterium]|nr:hypothetical protein [Opitutae bacterium]